MSLLEFNLNLLFCRSFTRKVNNSTWKQRMEKRNEEYVPPARKMSRSTHLRHVRRQLLQQIKRGIQFFQLRRQPHIIRKLLQLIIRNDQRDQRR